MVFIDILVHWINTVFLHFNKDWDLKTSTWTMEDTCSYVKFPEILCYLAKGIFANAIVTNKLIWA